MLLLVVWQLGTSQAIVVFAVPLPALCLISTRYGSHIGASTDTSKQKTLVIAGTILSIIIISSIIIIILSFSTSVRILVRPSTTIPAMQQQLSPEDAAMKSKAAD